MLCSNELCIVTVGAVETFNFHICIRWLLLVATLPLATGGEGDGCC